mmetsp:Transcript_7777/g.18040  ORF Transcript_7777/g.18040 Transcript_7777/m.18040 type:complete len:121 (-) Transcript_7777:518-880(-)
MAQKEKLKEELHVSKTDRFKEFMKDSLQMDMNKGAVKAQVQAEKNKRHREREHEQKHSGRVEDYKGSLEARAKAEEGQRQNEEAARVERTLEENKSPFQKLTGFFHKKKDGPAEKPEITW